MGQLKKKKDTEKKGIAIGIIAILLVSAVAFMIAGSSGQIKGKIPEDLEECVGTQLEQYACSPDDTEILKAFYQKYPDLDYENPICYVIANGYVQICYTNPELNQTQNVQ